MNYYAKSECEVVRSSAFHVDVIKRVSRNDVIARENGVVVNFD